MNLRVWFFGVGVKGYHVWRNKNGTLVEYHFDTECAESLSIDKFERLSELL